MFTRFTAVVLGVFVTTSAFAATKLPFPGFKIDAAVSSNEGALLATDDFNFKFDIRAIAPTQFVPHGVHSFPSSDGGRYSVGMFDGMNPSSTPLIYAYSDGGCCSDHIMTLDLQTGAIYDHHQHSAGPWENIALPDPTNQSSVDLYVKAIADLTTLLQENRAPQSVLNYLDQIRLAYLEQSIQRAAALANDHALFVSFKSIDTENGGNITIAYNVTTERDLLVDLFANTQGPGVYTTNWIGKGRVHVKAGRGTVQVPVTILPITETGGLESIKGLVKVLPTGADYPAALSEGDWTLYY